MSPSIHQVAQDILLKTDRKNITATQFLQEVSTVTRCSKESVRGTLIGYGPNKLMGQAWFKKSGWHHVPRGHGALACFTHNPAYAGPTTKIDYNTPTKRVAREFIFSDLREHGIPSVLTMAGPQGLDVQYVLGINKEAAITNIEQVPAVLKVFNKLKLPCRTYAGSMSAYLASNEKRCFDFINLDYMGYLCSYIHKDLWRINKSKMARQLAITLIDIKRIRNHGPFVDHVKNLYGTSEDPTLECIKDTLYNYAFIAEHGYKRDPDAGSRGMRILKFGIKP